MRRLCKRARRPPVAAPFVDPPARDQRDDLDYCPDCGQHHWRGLGHRCDPLRPAKGIVNGLLIMLVIAALLASAYLAGQALAREGRAERATPAKTTGAAVPMFRGAPTQAPKPSRAPKPIPAPQSLLRARQACPNTASLVECRGALRRALTAVEWQRH